MIESPEPIPLKIFTYAQVTTKNRSRSLNRVDELSYRQKCLIGQQPPALPIKACEPPTRDFQAPYGSPTSILLSFLHAFGTLPQSSTCRNCGGRDRGRVAIYRPFGEFRRAKIVLSPVWCSRSTTGVPLAYATMNFVGLDLTTSDKWH
ncbi:hypothetical protein TNCV_3017651 [Trichonephila clavipes]|nr:hypothetical protein TNCV_3017651 [Trichonephila clavipes]